MISLFVSRLRTSYTCIYQSFLKYEALLFTSGTTVDCVMYENITVSAEVVLAYRTLIAVEWTETIATTLRRYTRWIFEEQTAPVTAGLRDGDSIQGHTKYKTRLLVQRSKKKSTRYAHSLIWLHGKQMVITPCQMRRAYDHKSADVAVCWHVANLGETSRAEKSFTFEIRVADTETRWRSYGQTGGKTHHHQVCSRVHSTLPSRDRLLCWRRYQLEKQVFEMAIVEGNSKLTCVAGHPSQCTNTSTQSSKTDLQFCHKILGRFSSQLQVQQY